MEGAAVIAIRKTGAIVIPRFFLPVRSECAVDIPSLFQKTVVALCHILLVFVFLQIKHDIAILTWCSLCTC